MIREALLSVNPFSRPGFPMRGVSAIAIHWPAAPGQKPTQMRDYWEGLGKQSAGTPNPAYGSAHYIVDARETLLCVPENEAAYALGPWKDKTPWADKFFGGDGPNYHAISLELCHPTWDGVFPAEVLARAHLLCADLCLRYGLDPLSRIITHHAVTGKDCPHDWILHPEKLVAFRAKVHAVILCTKEI